MATNEYSFRSATLDAHHKALKTEKGKSGRKEIGTEQSASLTREPEHDCFKFDEFAAAEKAVRRIWGMYIRLCATFYLDCKTWRGKTELVGAVSHCGQCHGSHWCLTPSLYDDKIERIIDRIILLKGHALLPDRSFIAKMLWN